jgi:hypothetical protein
MKPEDFLRLIPEDHPHAQQLREASKLAGEMWQEAVREWPHFTDGRVQVRMRELMEGDTMSFLQAYAQAEDELFGQACITLKLHCPQCGNYCDHTGFETDKGFIGKCSSCLEG